MTPVGEYGTKLKQDKDDDYLETLNIEEGKTDKKQQFKAMANRQISVKQRQMAEAAARAWVESGGLSWNEFTQNTTFHGIKYIFEPSSHKIRKVMWVLIVIAAILFFVSQVSLRVIAYFEYNTNVEVEKVYKTTIQFPAVTVCNQNNYRMTVTADKDLYHYIDAVFGGTDDGTSTDITHYTDEDIDTTRFVLDTAHQLGDLIDSCTWKGKTCDLKTDWKTRQTDMGVCYTFNGGQDGEETREVTEGGAGLGLSLILNVEQYEYMMGPQNDAGIKILLHDQSEFPMIKDLGFAVAPGTHTLVGVNRFEIKSMEPPYGLCDASSVSMSDCRIQCRTTEIVKRCGCRDVYMFNVTGADVCSMEKTFGCVKTQLELMQKEENNCTCAVPCNRVSYEPALSYAQLSKFSVERLVLQDPTRRAAVEAQYKLAREDFQRVDTVTAEADTESLNTILGTTQELYTQLNVVVFNLTAGPLEGWIDQLEEALSADAHYMREDVEDFLENTVESMVKALWKYRYSMPELMAFATNMKDNMDNSVTLQNYLVDCVDVVTVQDNTGSSEEPMEKIDFPPGTPLSGKLEVIKHACSDLSSRLDFVLRLPEVYNSGISALYENTTSDPADLSQHTACEVQLAKLTDAELISKIEELATLLRDALGHPEDSNLMNLTQQIAVLTNETVVADFASTYTKVGDACGWVDDDLPDMDEISARVDGTSRYMSYVKTWYGTFEETVGTMRELLTDNLNGTVVSVKQYLNGQITKLEMAESFQSFLATSGLDELKTAQMSLAALSQKLTEKLETIRWELEDVYGDIFSLDIPPFNTERIRNLKIGDVGFQMGTERTLTLHANLTTTPKTSFPALMAEVVTNIQVPLEEMEEKISQASVEATNSLTAYTTKMEKYSQDTTMDESFFMENFMQVDVFYRELNSENVVQRASFELLSLFGEVGGFLGLLLGASILTVCELVDYITVTCLSRFKSKQQVAAAR